MASEKQSLLTSLRLLARTNDGLMIALCAEDLPESDIEDWLAEVTGVMRDRDCWTPEADHREELRAAFSFRHHPWWETNEGLTSRPAGDTLEIGGAQ